MFSDSNLENSKFNKFFVIDKDGRVSFTVLSDKLNLDSELLLEFLLDKDLKIEEIDGRKYLIGWKYRDEIRTPAASTESSFPQKIKKVESTEMSKEKIEQRKLYLEVEEYKRQLKIKNREIDSYKDLTRKHTREKLEMEESHRKHLDELAEHISLGHSLNERIYNDVNRLKKSLEKLSSKDVKIAILVDFNESAGNRHTRAAFVPKDQDYTFEIGDATTPEYKTHHNPDLRLHFMQI
jgi:hypothetical protein